MNYGKYTHKSSVFKKHTEDFAHFAVFITETRYAEQYDYIAHGCHVVNQLEKIREEAMVTIRTQIRTMYEQLETVARARMEEASDNKSW